MFSAKSRLIPHLRHVVSGCLVLPVLLVLGLRASAQAPVPLPGSVTTVVGGGTTSTGSATSPVACPAGSPYKSFDSYGNGCPGLQTTLSSGLRGGVAADGQGNVYIADTNNSEIRKYDPKSTVVSRVAGKGTNCTLANGLQDSSGDGCPTQQTSFASTPRGGGTCSSSAGILNQPRGVAADRFGNVYIAETGTTGAGQRYRVVLGPETYNGVTNPLWAVINGASYTPLNGTASATYTAHEGYIYTLLGGFAGTPSAAGGYHGHDGGRAEPCRGRDCGNGLLQRREHRHHDGLHHAGDVCARAAEP